MRQRVPGFLHPRELLRYQDERVKRVGADVVLQVGYRVFQPLQDHLDLFLGQCFHGCSLSARVLLVRRRPLRRRPRRRRPPRPTLCEAPTSPPPITMAWEDAGRHPQWPQVADVVIEAVKCSERTVTAPAAHLDLNLLISVQTFQVLL